MTAAPATMSGRPSDGSAAIATPELVRRVARAMVVVQIVIVSWLCLRGWFYADDFMFRGQGARYDWLDPAYVFQAWGGHYMPLSFVVAQPFSKLGGFDYLWVAVALAAGQALVAILLYRFLMRHFGPRWRVLIPLALYLTSMPVVQIAVWWATSLNSIPYLACMIIAADHTLRLARSGRRTEYLWILGSSVVALGFFEKAVLLPVVVGMLLVAVTPGPVWRTLLLLARRHAVLLVGYVAVLGGWFVLYRLSGSGDVARGVNLARLTDQISAGIVGTFVPSLFGGPWAWGQAESSYNAVPTDPRLSLVLTAVVLAGVLFAMTLGPRARRALAMSALYGALVLLLVNVGRSVFLVETASLPRYYSDLLMVVVISATLCLARLVRDPAPHMLDEWQPRRPRLAIVVAVVSAQALLVSYLVAVTAFAPGIGDGREARWTKAALVSLEELGPDERFLDGAVPGYVVWALVFPLNQYSWFFAGAPVPAFGPEVDQLRLLDDTGSVVPGRITGPTSEPGPVEGCGYLVQQAWVSIPMEAEVIRYDHLVHLATLSTQGTPLELRMGGDAATTVTVRAGLGDVYAAFLGGGRALEVRATRPGTTVCVSSVEIGAATSDPLPAAS